MLVNFVLVSFYSFGKNRMTDIFHPSTDLTRVPDIKRLGTEFICLNNLKSDHNIKTSISRESMSFKENPCLLDQCSSNFLFNCILIYVSV